MFSLAAKLYLAVAAFAALCGLGYLAAVGERTGWVLFLVVAVAASIAALAGVVGRVDDRLPLRGEADGPIEHRRVSPDAAATGSPWPFLAAAAATVLAVGTAAGMPVLVAGLVLALVPLAGWFAQAWREHPSFTRRLARRLDDRLVTPVLMPVGTFLVALGIAIAMSRVLLAVSKDAAAVVAIVVAVAILAALYLIAARPTLGSSGILGLAALGVVVLVAGGVAGAAMGEREFHKVGEDHGEEHGPEVFVAKGSVFERPGAEAVHAEAGKTVHWHFENLDEGVYHNVAVYEAEPGEGDDVVQGAPVFNGRPIPGGEVDYEFEAPDEPGTYLYVCDFHVLSMRGELVVE